MIESAEEYFRLYDTEERSVSDRCVYDTVPLEVCLIRLKSQFLKRGKNGY